MRASTFALVLPLASAFTLALLASAPGCSSSSEPIPLPGADAGMAPPANDAAFPDSTAAPFDGSSIDAPTLDGALCVPPGMACAPPISLCCTGTCAAMPGSATPSCIASE